MLKIFKYLCGGGLLLSLVLTAVPVVASGGLCNVITNTLSLNLPAALDTNHYVQLAGHPSIYYGLLQQAYDAADTGEVIQAQGLAFAETMTMETAKDVTLKGGWDSTFSTQSGFTILQGALTVRLGSLAVNHLIITSAKDLLPPAPAGITATAGSGQVTLSWNAVSNATSYNIYWSTAPGVTKANGIKISGAANPYIHTGRTNGTTCYYIITSVNIYGESSVSGQVSATPDSGSVPITITPVSGTSPIPLTPLTLATTGLVNGPVSVTFSNSAGFSFSSKPVRVKTDGTLIIAVPLYVDPITGGVTNGTVSLVVSHDSRVSAPVTINIQDLPTLDSYGMQPGEVSHAFFTYRALLLGGRIGQLQAESLLFGIDTSVLQSTLSASLEAVLSAQGDIESVMYDNSEVVTLGNLSNGNALHWDLSSQDMMDRILAVYLLQQFGNPPAPLTKVTARGTLTSAAPEVLAPAALLANLKEITAVIEDARTLPNLVRDWQKSESGLDYALAVMTAGAAYIPESVEVLRENQLSKKIGAGFGIYAIGRSAVDVSYDSGVFIIDSFYNGDSSAIGKDTENLNSSCVKLLDASASALTFGLLEGVKPGTPGSILGLALRDVEMLKAPFKEKETTLDVAFRFPDTFPSPDLGFGRITGTAPARSSLNLGFFGAAELGIRGIADPEGNFGMYVPLGVPETDYSNLTLSAGDFFSGEPLASETVDLSGLDSSQPLVVPPLTQNTYTLEVLMTGSGTVTSSPPGISCGPSGWDDTKSCSAGFAVGSVVTLTATPAPGAALSGWMYDCSGTGACAVTMDTYKGVAALFTGERWTAAYSGIFRYVGGSTHTYTNEPFTFEIQNGVLRHEGASATVGANGQITFGSIYNNWLFTGTINKITGTASGTWTLYNPGTGEQAGDGSGSWTGNRMLP